ncbi:MAG: ROK family protein [Candidatus Omnitrophota bacterium]
MESFLARETRLSEKERRNLEILDAIRRGGEISRADISKLTDLNIVTVSNYVGKYIKNKLVFETGLDISTGGRRPELLKLNRQHGYSLGIDLGAPHLTIDSSLRAVVMDLSGAIVARKSVKKEYCSFEKMTEKVMDLAGDIVDSLGINSQDVKGIGVGIWGVMDRYKGTVRYAVENEQIVSYMGLLNQLEMRFGVPAVIEHDATLAAFGERWSGLGAGSTADNLIFMCSDSSCGLVVRGELYYGASKSAGELNLNPPYSGGDEKPVNCWETYEKGCCMRSRGIDLGVQSSARELAKKSPDEARAILEKAGGDIEKVDLDSVIAASEDGDMPATRILEEAGSYLGAKMSFLINLFNPEVVIVGRGIEKTGDIFFSAVRRSVKRWAYDETVKIVKILPTSLGEEVVAVGAAGLVIQDFFAKV